MAMCACRSGAVWWGTFTRTDAPWACSGVLVDTRAAVGVVAMSVV